MSDPKPTLHLQPVAKAKIAVAGMSDAEIFELMPHIAKRLNLMSRHSRTLALSELFNALLPEGPLDYASKINQPLK